MTSDEILQTVEAIDKVLLSILDPSAVSSLLITQQPPLTPTLLAHACRDLANICGEQQLMINAQQQQIDKQQRQIDSLIEVHGS
jgi:hypothetical protein